MKPAALTVPGLLTGGYPERDFAGQGRGEARTGLRAPAPVERHRQRRFIALVERNCERFAPLTGPAWTVAVREVRARLAAEGFADEAAAQAFALAREATRRTLGKTQFHTQIIAARIMLSGRLAEMATGEGKTLAAVLTAATAALAGIPVHVLTAND